MSDIIKINGVRIAVSEAGSGQPMILIHGRGYSKEMMGRISAHYAGKYHVFSYDVRGHGESDKPQRFTMDDDAEDLRALIDYYGLEKPAVVGFSMGSYIALKAAEKYPSLFSRIVLIGTKGGGSTSSTERIRDDAKMGGLSREQLAELMVRRVFAPQVTMEEIAAFDREIASPVKLTDENQQAITRSMQNFDLMTDACRVEIPALVMTGEFDGMNPPEEGRKVAQALPNARFEVIPGAGHIAFFENPNRVLALMDEFLENT